MCEVARIMEMRGLNIPLLVGGATTSPMHTAVKIAPCYSGPVIHTHDAAALPPIIQKLSDPATRAKVIKMNHERQAELRLANENKRQKLTLEEARARRPKLDYAPIAPKQNGVMDMMLPINEVRKFINWRAFMSAWKLDASLASVADIKGCDHCRAQWLASIPTDSINKAAQAMQLYKDAERTIDFLSSGLLKNGIKARLAILPALSSASDSIIISFGENQIELATPRQRAVDKDERQECLALSDFIAPANDNGKPSDWIGLFAVTTGTELEDMAQAMRRDGDEYRSLLYQTLAHRLAEAATEYLHLLARTTIWGYSNETPAECLKDLDYEGIRPAIGYPSLPDQKLVFTADRILDYSSQGITLTENGAMHPSASTTGLIIAHPSSRYFII